MKHRLRHWRVTHSILVTVILFISSVSFAQDDYARYQNYVKNFDFKDRITPQIPDKNKKLRVIIDADAKNEIDDQWAVTLALLSSERFQIEGFVAANYDNDHGGPGGLEKSYQELKLVLKKAGFEGKYPVYKGSHPMRYKYEPSESEGVV